MSSSADRFVGVLEASGDRVALIDGAKMLTYQELVDSARDLAESWREAGIEEGDRIAVELPNCADFVICYLACMYGNFTIIPINNGLPLSDLEYILEITQPVLRIKGELEFTPPKRKIARVKINPDSTFSIAFTSGTTSRPKGVCHRVEALLKNVFVFNEFVGLGEHTRMLHVLPMGYMAGFLNTILSPLAGGGAIVIAPQFSAASARSFWVAAMEREVNTTWLTPTMVALLARLHRDPKVTEWARDHLSHVFVGTAPLPDVNADRFEEAFDVPCFESYGMTEVLLVSVVTPSQGRMAGSVGHLLPGVQVEARAKDGVPLLSGEEGDLFVSSPFELKGYLNPDTGAVELKKEDGYFPTGDFGRVDAAGNLFITGRTKDLIIHGGVNVSPRAVEEALLRYSGIIEAAVLGEAHPFWGEEVVAFLVVEGDPPSLDALQAHCKDFLVADAIPAKVIVMDEFPKSSTGKVAKNQLREAL